jgi:hypothetical protein
MTIDTAKFISESIVIGSALFMGMVWIPWDAWVFIRFGREATLSHFIWQSSQDHPYLWLAVFQLLSLWAWHLFIGPEGPPGSVSRKG